MAPSPGLTGRKARWRRVVIIWLMATAAMVTSACANPPATCPGARTTAVDEFSAPTIDATKWRIDDPAGLLSLHDGRLVYTGTVARQAMLTARQGSGAGFFVLKFRDFHTSNNSPAAVHAGSFGALGLGVGDNFVRVMRGAVVRGGYFEANHFVDGTVQVWHVGATAGEGMLGLLYDGSAVTSFYNTGSDPGQGWTQVGPVISPGWRTAPKLFVSGYPGGSGTTRFAVDSITQAVCPAR